MNEYWVFLLFGPQPMLWSLDLVECGDLTSDGNARREIDSKEWLISCVLYMDIYAVTNNVYGFLMAEIIMGDLQNCVFFSGFLNRKMPQKIEIIYT